MAAVAKEALGPLHEKLTISIEQQDYMPAFENALKKYSKNANIPGFRKGMVPIQLVKKMFGASLFADEVLRTADQQLVKYLQDEKVDFLGQPMPLEADITELDHNAPASYSFSFELGLKPDIQLPDLKNLEVTRYNVKVTDEMVNEQVNAMQRRLGKVEDVTAIENDDTILNLVFEEVDAEGNLIEGGLVKDNSILAQYFSPAVKESLIGKNADYSFVTTLKDAFEDKEREWIISDMGAKDTEGIADKSFKISFTKLGILNPAALDTELFKQVFPNDEVADEAAFRSKIREDIEQRWSRESDNQLQHQAYHILIDNTVADFPESFLKRWIKTQPGNDAADKEEKTDEQVEQEYPEFASQLKWTLVIDKIVRANEINVSSDEIKNAAMGQLFSYMGQMGMGAPNDVQPWMTSYVDKMMKDKKYVEQTYHSIEVQKVLEWTAKEFNPAIKELEAKEFEDMVNEHQHHHH